jgi:hypothetical protein
MSIGWWRTWIAVKGVFGIGIYGWSGRGIFKNSESKKD